MEMSSRSGEKIKLGLEFLATKRAGTRGKVEYGDFGLKLYFSERRNVVEVDEVAIEGVAYAGGIRVGDEILAIAGVTVDGSGKQALNAALYALRRRIMQGDTDIEWSVRHSAVGELTSSPSRSNATSAPASAARSSQSLPLGWKPAVSRSTGAVYYVNIETNESTYELPVAAAVAQHGTSTSGASEEAVPPTLHDDALGGNVSASNTEVINLPGGWVVGKTRDDDDMLYINTVTNERFFELPHNQPATASLLLPEGWGKALSGSTGATYFVKPDGSSTYSFPGAPTPAPAPAPAPVPALEAGVPEKAHQKLLRVASQRLANATAKAKATASCCGSQPNGVSGDDNAIAETHRRKRGDVIPAGYRSTENTSVVRLQTDTSLDAIEPSPQAQAQPQATNTVDFSASVPAPDASPQTVALFATAAKTAMYVGTTLSPDPAAHWAKEAYLPGVEWTKGKWAVAIFEFTAEKDGDLSLQVDQVIQLEHGEPKKFWKGVDPKTGKRGIFPKKRVSVLSKAIAIEDLMVPGPHFLKLKKHDVVVICGTVVKNRVVTGYTGFVEAFPGAIGNIALQSVVVDLEASHQAVEAKIRGRQPPPSAGVSHEVHSALKDAHTELQNEVARLRKQLANGSGSGTPNGRDAGGNEALTGALELLITVHKADGTFDTQLWLGKEERISLWSSIAELKDAVTQKTGITPSQQLLSYHTVRLDAHGKKVGDYGITSMSELDLSSKELTSGSASASTTDAQRDVAQHTAAAFADTTSTSSVRIGNIGTNSVAIPKSPNRQSYKEKKAELMAKRTQARLLLNANASPSRSDSAEARMQDNRKSLKTEGGASDVVMSTPRTSTPVRSNTPVRRSEVPTIGTADTVRLFYITRDGKSREPQSFSDTELLTMLPPAGNAVNAATLVWTAGMASWATLKASTTGPYLSTKLRAAIVACPNR